MDLRLDRVNRSIVSFFENETSGSFLGLPQHAQNHLEKFRTFLKSFYAKQYGCWPPTDFEEEIVQQAVYSAMFADFQNLYEHLVSSAEAEEDISKTGGLCTLQNIQAFDRKNSYEPLIQLLPQLPEPFEASSTCPVKLQQRMSWKPAQKRKALKEMRKSHDKQALIAASNRDLLVMDCPLVRQYSEFEESIIDDDLEGLSTIEGRKVRWILIYAVLQTFHSIAQPPKEVRNSSHLTYSLCCRPPPRKPWQEQQLSETRTLDHRLSQLAPDISYSHTNLSLHSVGETLSRGRSATRRRTMPANLPGSLVFSIRSKTPPASRSTSLRRFVTRKVRSAVEESLQKRPAFCEIYIEGYGNGLNEVTRNVTVNTAVELAAGPGSMDRTIEEEIQGPQELQGDTVHEMATNDDMAPWSASEDSANTPPGMSRESSVSSTKTTSSNPGQHDDIGPLTPTSRRELTLVEILQASRISPLPGSIKDSVTIKASSESLAVECIAPGCQIIDNDEHHDPDLELPYVHFTTETWDEMLQRNSMTVPRVMAISA